MDARLLGSCAWPAYSLLFKFKLAMFSDMFEELCCSFEEDFVWLPSFDWLYYAEAFFKSSSSPSLNSSSFLIASISGEYGSASSTSPPSFSTSSGDKIVDNLSKSKMFATRGKSILSRSASVTIVLTISSYLFAYFL
jgi:hypothetical protein